MKRALLSAIIIGLAVASLLRAQVAGQATLVTPTAQQRITVVEQSGIVFFPVDEVMTALGGSVAPAQDGYRVSLQERHAFFGTDSRFAVYEDEMIEMPADPIEIESRPFVAWQFFQGFLRSLDLNAAWNPDSRALSIGPLQREAVRVDAAVVQIDQITQVVFQFSSKVDYQLIQATGSVLLQFRNPLQPPFQQQAYDNPNVTQVEFSRDAIRIRLAARQVAVNSYTLSDPFRIVLEMKRGAAPLPGEGIPPLPLRPVDAPGIRTIVIDPGHGGKEVGATGAQGLMEKDVTLALARRIRQMLTETHGVRVVLTRDDDQVVPLDQRTAIANQYRADLFLSIHLNAAPVREARGSETYFLSLEASDERARLAAERENAPAGPAAAGSDLDLMLWDLAQQRYLKDSSRFAEFLQEELAVATGIEKRGVKQAPFRVLIGATMPAALVEVGFISNPDEEAKLATSEYQQSVARALVDAVSRYKQEYESRSAVAFSPPAQQTLPSDPAATTAASDSGRSRR